MTNNVHAVPPFLYFVLVTGNLYRADCRHQKKKNRGDGAKAGSDQVSVDKKRRV